MFKRTNKRNKLPQAAGRGFAYAGLIFGGVLTIAANIAHTFIPPHGAPPGWEPRPTAIVIAACWPVALFFAIEVAARVCWPDGKWWMALRLVGPVLVAGMSGIVSWRHQNGLLTWLGEDTVVSWVGPIAIDGLMISCTAALVASGAAIRAAQAAQAVAKAEARAEAPPRVAKRKADERTLEDIAMAARKVSDARPGITRKDLAVALKVSEAKLRQALAPKPASMPAYVPPPPQAASLNMATA